MNTHLKLYYKPQDHYYNTYIMSDVVDRQLTYPILLQQSRMVFPVYIQSGSIDYVSIISRGRILTRDILLNRKDIINLILTETEENPHIITNSISQYKFVQFTKPVDEIVGFLFFYP